MFVQGPITFLKCLLRCFQLFFFFVQQWPRICAHFFQLSGFLCFPSKVTLALDPEKINILHGENGSGKSSLLWALIRGLLDTYRAGGKAVEALRPWGTHLSPTVEQLNIRLIRLQAQLDGALLHVQFTPDADARIEVLQGSPSGSHQFAAGEDIRVTGSPTVELVLKGFGRMRVTGPASSALELEQKLEKVLNQIQELTAQFGSDELGELKRRRQRAVVLETEIVSTRKSLQQFLEERTAEALRAETERLYDCYLC